MIFDTAQADRDYGGPDHHLLPRDYRDAVLVVDPGACNSTGVIHSMNEIAGRIFEESMARGQGTDWRNRHPIMVLILSQLGQLAGTPTDASLGHFGWALDFCKAKAEAQDGAEPQDAAA